MKKRELVFGLISSVLFLGGCASLDKLMPASIVEPTNEMEYTAQPFKKLINPAFSEDVSSKWIRCNVTFVGIQNRIADLPSEYQNGWIRFTVCDIGNPGSMSINVVIPKNNSDKLFELNAMDPIEIFAYLVPINTTYALTGRTQGGVLFRVVKINQTAKHAKTAAINWHLKAVILMQSGNEDGALQAYDKALEADPEFAIGWYNRACLFLHKGQKDDVLINLKKAIELDVKLKETVRRDKDWDKYRDDADLKKIIE